MNNYDASEHMSACNRFAQASPDNTERMLQFVLATIQQRLETVPMILDKFVEHGSATAYAFGSKAHGLDYIADNKQIIHDAAKLAVSMGDDDRLLQLFLLVPGLGLVKAGFACQLFAGCVGCLDVHNVTLYGLSARALRFDKNTQPSTQAKHRRNYIGLCASLGGPIALWAKWCDYKASINPRNWTSAGYSVSLLHVEAMHNAYDHNIPAFMREDDTPRFRSEEV